MCRKIARVSGVRVRLVKRAWRTAARRERLRGAANNVAQLVREADPGPTF